MSAKAKVLVIDDDQDVLTTSRLFLQSRGFEVLTASEPEEGFRLAEQGRPDVVVLDVMMPHGTEGFQWVSRIRHHADAALRNMPVIILTSIHTTTGIRFREGDADETGDYLPVQGFLDKPFDPDELFRKIESILGSSA
ncbi:MAG TPA: response regulator [Armatimonadota bacterium]|nr:response regulator [Armatimonadota bacterium]